MNERQTRFTFRMLVGGILAASEAPSAKAAGVAQGQMTLAGGGVGRRCDEPLQADEETEGSSEAA